MWRDIFIDFTESRENENEIEFKNSAREPQASFTIAFNFQLSVNIVFSLLDEFFFFNATEYISKI